jgi:hypothetical protein
VFARLLEVVVDRGLWYVGGDSGQVAWMGGHGIEPARYYFHLGVAGIGPESWCSISFILAIISCAATYRWLEVQPTPIPNEWLGKIHILNRSSFGWRVVQAVVPVTKIPLTDKQDFLIRAVTENEPAKAFGFVASFSGGILPGESGTCPIVLRRGPLSDASVVTIDFTIQSMVAKPHNKTLIIKGTLPRYGLTMVLD